MSKHLITHVYDQATVDKLIENRLSFYAVDTPEDSHRAGRSAYGALEYVQADSPLQLLLTFQEKLEQGYTLNKRLPVTVMQTGGYGTFSCYMAKPAEAQARDFQAIKAEVTDSYNEQRRQAFEAHRATIVAESLERARRAEAKKAAEAEAKLIAKLEREATEALGGEFA
ncbi:hypothetical protein L1F06_016975 [Ectopseudomonas hydrolytica]|uniref:Uncharacterized protein n=1 Tax=Ectopseudomonas hydrolytica TaxID=2493633 RepID=A0ABY5A5X9_9GAMM|nr:hypothetical protein [Pseudomonas hydrolytica]USR38353.1 hypothetical protein L1F06_016975 [Pseudomonas hydrolytica]